jgi:uncharacterized membrane protein
MFGSDRPYNLLFLLTAHHPPCQLNRTFHVGIGSRKLYLCTRCLGQWIGVALSIGWGLITTPAEKNLAESILVFGLLPFPIALDWSTQTLGLRESNNPLRLLTGWLYGVSLSQYVFALLRQDCTATWVGTGAFLCYMLVFCFIVSRPGIAATYLRPYEAFIREYTTGKNSKLCN